MTQQTPEPMSITYTPNDVIEQQREMASDLMHQLAVQRAALKVALNRIASIEAENADLRTELAARGPAAQPVPVAPVEPTPAAEEEA